MRRPNPSLIGFFLLSLLCMYGRSDAAGVHVDIKGRPSAAVNATPARGSMKPDSCVTREDTRPFLGSYHVLSVERVAGGLTSELKARSKSATPVVLSPVMYRSGWMDASISNPRYRVSCYPVEAAEGDVPVVMWNAHWTNFYGLGMSRKVIKVLEVYDPADAGPSPYTWFEVVNVDGNEQLWQQHDGWLLRMTRAHRKPQ